MLFLLFLFSRKKREKSLEKKLLDKNGPNNIRKARRNFFFSIRPTLATLPIRVSSYYSSFAPPTTAAVTVTTPPSLIILHRSNTIKAFVSRKRGTAPYCSLCSIFYKNIEKRQLWVRPVGGWNSTLQAASHVRHVHWARLCYVPFVAGVCELHVRYDCWYQVRQAVRACSICILHERYRAVTPLGATMVNSTTLRGRCCPQPFCAQVLYIPHGGRRLRHVWYCYMLKQNETRLSKKSHPFNTRIGRSYMYWVSNPSEWVSFALLVSSFDLGPKFS